MRVCTITGPNKVGNPMTEMLNNMQKYVVSQMPKPEPALKCLDKFVDTWEVQGDTLKISVAYGPVNATFNGKFSKAGNSFSGGWRPNPGADETVNVPYDVGQPG